MAPSLKHARLNPCRANALELSAPERALKIAPGRVAVPSIEASRDAREPVDQTSLQAEREPANSAEERARCQVLRPRSDTIS